jgi:hypothetical protein
MLQAFSYASLYSFVALEASLPKLAIIHESYIVALLVASRILKHPNPSLQGLNLVVDSPVQNTKSIDCVRKYEEDSRKVLMVS